MSSADPITEYLSAAERARAHQVDTAPVSLGTVDAAGHPAVRIVLLRGVDERGFAFFTNYNSRKGRELSANPHAALCVHWVALDEQIRIEGSVTRLSDAESDEYFASRPRGSQLGAWASRQSRPLAAHDLLLERFADLQADYQDRDIPRPRWWGGYRVIPERIEFWKSGPHRLHKRELYTRDGDGWRVELLNP